MEIKNMQRLCGMLGFAQRAGKTVIGVDLICRAMPKGKIELVLVSASASAATKKKIFCKCEYYRIRSVEAGIDTDALAAVLGKDSGIAAVAILDPGFAKEILGALASEL